ncbi:ABC transporter ATP-binding protein [Streptomyces sp. NPDC004393]
METTIAGTALTKRYGDRLAVDALDLEVRAGEVFGLLGPNGAGKTTTMRMLLGLIRPDSGTATVLGESLPPKRRLTQIGAMIEEPAFHPQLSGRENLHVLSDLGSAVSAQRISDTLETAGLNPSDGRRVRTYSQGMRQRLALAAALLRRPRLLILDEPTNGLDPAGIREFRLLMRELADAGATIVLSSHLLSEVEQVCDRVAIMSRGRTVALGAPAELGSGTVGVRITVRNADLTGALAALTAFKATSGDVGPHHAVLHANAPNGRTVISTLATAGIYPDSVTAHRTGLEELYLTITDDNSSPTSDETEDDPNALAPR